MTFDKQSHGHTAKPLTPTLSSAFSRPSKSPLTPKLANASVRAPRRLAPSDNPTPTPARQGSELSYLNTNATPRSGSRNSRRDGPIHSPGGTPASAAHSPQSFVQASQAQPRTYRTDRSPVRTGGKLEPSRTARAKTLSADLNTASRHHSTEFRSDSPMFFHASDARSVSGSSDMDTRSRVSIKSSSPAGFVYANGQEEAQSPVEDTVRRRSSGLNRPAVVARPTAPPRLMSPQRSAASPRFSDNSSSIGAPQLDDSPEIRSPLHSPPLTSQPAKPVPVICHTKSASLDSARDAAPHELPKEGLRPSPIIVSTSEAVEEKAFVPNTTSASRPRVFSNGSTTSLDCQSDGLQSPVKSDHAGSSGPVLSSRVERKILDLEISNSSLLAINRTLEREMRKQNAELQRFRRLSRSGRLPMAPSSRSTSGSRSIPNKVDEDASGHSSDGSDDEMTDEESVLGASPPTSDPAADEDAQQGVRDEKRFLTDLAKHQDLLADSQKMNQSLKRCLGWTEELIREAKKALEYNVHANDVQLGGRVLNSDELNESESGRGLLATGVLPSPDTELPDFDGLGEDPPSS
ncbi:hypothetical protein BJX61DRAFT_489919 [Aspergillus egyptiacus]|nr:hypothetical protein BJX61DRAFT_489919 [Aspergillus egyptiacus]